MKPQIIFIYCVHLLRTYCTSIDCINCDSLPHISSENLSEKKTNKDKSRFLKLLRCGYPGKPRDLTR